MFNKLSEEYYYFGSLNDCGERTSLTEVRAQFREGWDITAVDLNPGCLSDPYRLFVAAAPFEILEVLEEHCRREPTGLVARRFLSELDDEEEEYTPFVLYHDGKKYGPTEDWILAVQKIEDIQLLRA